VFRLWQGGFIDPCGMRNAGLIEEPGLGKNSSRPVIRPQSNLVAANPPLYAGWM